MRKPIIAGNWKLFKTRGEAIEMITKLKTLVADVSGVEIVVTPVFTALDSVYAVVSGTNINLGAQNCFWEEEGAYTGEVSPKLLKDIGCSHVIIGHSERRQYFGETDVTVNKKLKAAIAERLTALFCIGETLQEREAAQTFDVIETQLVGGLSGLNVEEMGKIVIAYEPVWAIGTGKTASNEQAQEVHSFIRTKLSSIYDNSVATATRILYGGSVKPENIKALMAQSDIDGALVGGASLNAESFAGIVRYGV